MALQNSYARSLGRHLNLYLATVVLYEALSLAAVPGFGGRTGAGARGPFSWVGISKTKVCQFVLRGCCGTFPGICKQQKRALHGSDTSFVSG